MRTGRIDQTLELCRAHLDSIGPASAEINSLFAKGSLVIIYAEFERLTHSVLQEKLAPIDDRTIRAFAESFLRAATRDISSRASADLLNRFGPGYRTTFRNKVGESLENQRSQTAYNNIITNRNDVAHSTGSNVTFQDVQSFYEQGHVILDFFRETLLAIDISEVD